MQTICKSDPNASLSTAVNIDDNTANPSPREQCNHQVYVGDSEASSTDNNRPKSETDKKRFELWHRRFAHCNPEKLRYLYKVTDLKERIRILSSEKRSPCEVCKLSKLQNRIRKELSL
jgi:hypothetical protein